MINDSGICRPYGARDVRAAVSTKMSLLTELGDAQGAICLACTGNPSSLSLYHLLEVMGRIERGLNQF